MSKANASGGGAHNAAADDGVYSTVGGVKRNAKGGVHVSQTELHQAFEFFDVDGKGQRHAQLATLAIRHGVIR